MAQDLVILKLLKFPVIIIRFIFNSLAMLTYLPNYLVFLLLDNIIFSPKLVTNLKYYVASWIPRLLCLSIIILIFKYEAQAVYNLLDIHNLYYYYQIPIVVTVILCILSLMRHGYLSMIKKYQPEKLKSPYEHIQQLWFFIVDICSLTLTAINILLIINISEIYRYKDLYDPNSKYKYLQYIIISIRNSLVQLIKLFYVKIFFKWFSWRYNKFIQQVNKQQKQNNVLGLFVLLTLIFWGTLIDILFITIFGLYCKLHPKNHIYKQMDKKQYRKYRTIVGFSLFSAIQLWQLSFIAIFGLIFEYEYSRNLIKEIWKQKKYSWQLTNNHFHKILYILKVASLKIPAFILFPFVFLSYYKHKKKTLMLKQIKKQQNIYNQAGQIDPYKEQIIKNKKPTARQSSQFITIQMFFELIKQLPVFICLILSTLLCPWVLFWVKFPIIINPVTYNVNKKFLLTYLISTLFFWLFLPLAVLIYFLKLVFHPTNIVNNTKKLFSSNRKSKQSCYNYMQKVYKQVRQYEKQDINLKQLTLKGLNYEFQLLTGCHRPQHPLSYVLPLRNITVQAISQFDFKQILFFPSTLLSKYSFFSIMGCQHPQSPIQNIEFFLMLFYIKRLKNSSNFDFYLKTFKSQDAAGMLSSPRKKLLFWKYAHKAHRHFVISKILQKFLPTKRGDKAIVNAFYPRLYSQISNHYWHRYNITISLLKALLFFVIELIVTLFGVLIMMPLTLWRMPTFLLLFRMHGFNKKYFFPILFTVYKQMLLDVIQVWFKLFTFFFVPITTFTFLKKSCFRYSDKDPQKQKFTNKEQQKVYYNNIIKQFKKVQQLKYQYITQIILVNGFKSYSTLWKVFIVKLFWVRKQDMNIALTQNKIKLREYAKQLLTKRPYVKSVPQLLSSSGIGQANLSHIPLSAAINKVINESFELTIDDIPYLLLMVIIFISLPWRIFYIKKALYLMRQDKNNRRQVIKLLRKIAKDYQCIFLYIILILSVIKTKRTLKLIYRNAKLNFYVGFLKYSHLNELKHEIKQAYQFYLSLFIVFLACAFAPYRFKQIMVQLKKLYKKYCDEQKNKK